MNSAVYYEQQKQRNPPATKLLQKQKYLQRKNIFHDKMQFYLDNKVI